MRNRTARNPHRRVAKTGGVDGPVWLFDLDNTLHDASAHIFPRINREMTRYIENQLEMTEQAANQLRETYWARYGATLLGLVRHHGVNPHHFLRETHPFPDLEHLLVFDPAIRTLLQRLPGRKVLFSNSPVSYARRVLRGMRIEHLFDAVYSIEQLKLRPKPLLPAYVQLLRTRRVSARRCILVEDSLVNLAPAKRLGMRTVWITHSHRSPPEVDRKVRHVRQLMLAPKV